MSTYHSSTNIKTFKKIQLLSSLPEITKLEFEILKYHIMVSKDQILRYKFNKIHTITISKLKTTKIAYGQSWNN